jgi:hypothetical protein
MRPNSTSIEEDDEDVPETQRFSGVYYSRSCKLKLEKHAKEETKEGWREEEGQRREIMQKGIKLSRIIRRRK